MKKTLYEYVDYRCFLQERFLEMKATNPRFSYRAFNRRAGIGSSAFLKLVMDGKRNLGPEGIIKVSRGLKLTPEEENYFSHLVAFNQATSHGEKDQCFQDLMKFKPFLRSKSLSSIQYEMFLHWHMIALLELLRLDTQETKNEDWLKSRLEPKVGLREIQKSLNLLRRLGLVEKSSQGGYERRSPMLKTPDAVASLNIVHYHQQMSELAARAVAEQHSTRREFSGLTVAVNEESFELAKHEIKKFRRKLHNLLENENSENKTRVLQFNLQLFELGNGID